MAKFKTHESSMAVGRGWVQWGVGGKEWDEGTIVTHDGYIELYRQADVATVHFVYDGREFSHQIEPAPSKAGLVRMAKRFAADAIEKHEARIDQW